MKAKNEGTATIKAKVGKKTYKCKVRVNSCDDDEEKNPKTPYFSAKMKQSAPYKITHYVMGENDGEFMLNSASHSYRYDASNDSFSLTITYSGYKYYAAYNTYSIHDFPILIEVYDSTGEKIATNVLDNLTVTTPLNRDVTYSYTFDNLKPGSYTYDIMSIGISRRDW